MWPRTVLGGVCGILLLSCSSELSLTPKEPAPPKPTATVAPSPSPPEVIATAAAVVPVELPADSCAGAGPLLGCGELRGAGPNSAQDERIVRLEEAIRQTSFRDANLMVELARLQLARDNELQTPDGSTDLERAKRNALRAVVVNPGDAQGEIVLTLALMRTFAEARPAARQFVLHVIQQRAEGIADRTGRRGAMRLALLGQVAVSRGDFEGARIAFAEAVALDAALQVAHVGLGDAARGRGMFKEAGEHYLEALRLRPDDQGVLRALGATERQERLFYGSVPALPATLADLGLLGDLDVPVVKCGVRQAQKAPDLCRAAGLLAAAKSPAALETAATEVVQAHNNTDCKPVNECAFVAPVLLDGARAFLRTSSAGKGIQLLKVLSRLEGTDKVSGASSLQADVSLLLGDAYVRFAMFDQAADNYRRHFELRGAAQAGAGRRSLVLDLALGREATALQTARALSSRAQLASTDRKLVERIIESKDSAVTACGGLFGCFPTRAAQDDRWVGATTAR